MILQGCPGYHRSKQIKVPKDVTVSIASRKVEVKGKHGTLKRDFRHLPVDLKLVEGGKKIKVRDDRFLNNASCHVLLR